MAIIPNLGLVSIKDAELIEFAENKSTKIGGVGAFAAVVPSVATVNTKIGEYNTALVAADNGTRAQTQAKDDKRKELEALLTLQAQNISEISGANLTLYLSSGYKAKDTQGTPTGALPAVTGLLLDYGDSAGELKASWNNMADAQNFSVQFYSDALSPDTSVIKEFVQGKIGRGQATFAGLPSGQIVFGRVRANGGSTGFGPYSDPAEKRVP